MTLLCQQNLFNKGYIFFLLLVFVLLISKIDGQVFIGYFYSCVSTQTHYLTYTSRILLVINLFFPTRYLDNYIIHLLCLPRVRIVSYPLVSNAYGVQGFYALILGCIITTRYLDKFIILLFFLLRAGVQKKIVAGGDISQKLITELQVTKARF